MDRHNYPTLSLTCGILAFVGFSVLTSIPAWIMGHQALKDPQTLTASQLSQAKIGKALGIIGTVIGVVGLILAFVLTGLIFQILQFLDPIYRENL